MLPVGKEIEVAIVFADVVGSTKLYELLGDLRAREMVGICIEVMRAATDQNHGTVIKTMGDEVMATFPTADDHSCVTTGQSLALDGGVLFV